MADDELLDLQAQVTRYRELREAMDLRIIVKDSEIHSLQRQIENLRSKFSILSHSMQECKRPIFTDSYLNALLLQFRAKLRQKQERLNLLESGSHEFMGRNFARMREQQDRWQKTTESNLTISRELSETQDIEGELQRLCMIELKVRLTESQELVTGLEAESKFLTEVWASLLQRYSQAREQLRVLERVKN